MITPLSELKPYEPGSIEASEAVELHAHLGRLVTSVVAKTNGGIWVSAGRMSHIPLTILRKGVGGHAKFGIVIDQFEEGQGFPTFAVLPDMVCAYNYPMKGLANVCDVGDIALVGDWVDGTKLSAAYSAIRANSDGLAFESQMERLYGAHSALTNFDTRS